MICFKYSKNNQCLYWIITMQSKRNCQISRLLTSKSILSAYQNPDHSKRFIRMTLCLLCHVLMRTHSNTHYTSIFVCFVLGCRKQMPHPHIPSHKNRSWRKTNHPHSQKPNSPRRRWSNTVFRVCTPQLQRGIRFSSFVQHQNHIQTRMKSGIAEEKKIYCEKHIEWREYE